MGEGEETGQIDPWAIETEMLLSNNSYRFGRDGSAMKITHCPFRELNVVSCRDVGQFTPIRNF